VKYPITPEYIQALPDKLATLYIDLESFVIQDICSRMKYSGTMTETAIELIKRLKRIGYDQKAIEKYLKQTMKLSDRQFDAMWTDAINRNQRYFDAVVTKDALLDATYDQSVFDAEIDTIYRQTKGALQNITQSMGFVTHQNGQPVFSSITDTYQKILDDAAMRVQSGAESYNVAIRGATKQLTDSGLQTVSYESGKIDRVDVAARRAVMTGITQLSSQYSEQECDIMETPYREVSAHKGARDISKPHPWSNHKAWQGKVYSIRSNDKYPSIYQVCGLGQVDGLCGANCRHMYYGFFDGISERTYTDQELANIDGPPINYQGRTYNAYQATQKQRQLENAMRKTKRELVCLKALGQTEAYNVKAARLIRLKTEYSNFSRAAGLRMQSERANIAEFGYKEGREALAAYNKMLSN